MTDTHELLAFDPSINLEPSKPKRIWEIDFLRGICVILMMLDHLAIFFGTIFGPEWYGYTMAGDNVGAKFCRWCEFYFYESTFRQIAWPTVLFIFFSISGISCSFSRSNAKRGGMLAAFALIYSGLSIAAESLFNVGSIKVVFGVLHFYAVCILIYALIDFLAKRNKIVKIVASATIVIVVLCLYFLYTPPAGTSMWWGIVFPSTDFHGYPTFYHSYELSPGDHFSLIPWSAFFFIGTMLGPILYRKRRSLLPFLDGAWQKPVAFVGRHAIIFYFAHIVVIPLILMTIGALFITPGNWVLF